MILVWFCSHEYCCFQALIEQQANLSISKKALQKVSEELHASAVKILPFQEKIAKGRTTYGTATGAIVHAKRTIEATVNAFRPEMYATEPDTVQHEVGHVSPCC